jgi:NAD(P)-dependent dehydrogenase (short-subunit alcohol dehydrogenase family)
MNRPQDEESTMTGHPEQVAMVTGASRGIGALSARALAEHGYAVALLARREESLRDVAGQVREAGGEVLTLGCDVTSQDEVDAAVGRIMEQWGRIDVLVNSAGLIEAEVPLWEADADQWWQVVETNVRGPFLTTRAVVRATLGRGVRIINLNSGTGTKESPVLSAYSASKAALGRITGGTAAAGADHGVLAFDLAPGVVRTDMTRSMEIHRDRTEWTDPAEVTALMVALASGELDAWSGRMVRAGTDAVSTLQERAGQGLGDAARKVRLTPWGDDDPVAG